MKKKNVWKIVGTTISLIFIVLASLLILGFLYLSLNKDAELFGVKLITNKQTYVYSEENLTNLKEISIESNNYDLDIGFDKDIENIYAKTYNNVSGLAIAKKCDAVGNFSLDKDGIILSLRSPKYKGAISFGTSKIIVRLPELLADKNIKLTINGKEIDINVSGLNEVECVSSINIFGSDCSVFVDSVSIIGQNSIDLYNSKLEYKENCKFLNECNFTLKLNKSNLQIKNNLESGEIDNVNVKSIKSSTLKINSLKNLYTNTLIEASGNITIDTLNYVNTNIAKADITINMLEGEQKSYITTSSGRIILKGVNCELVATSSTGSIKLENSKKPLVVKSDTGKVNIQNAEKRIDAETNSGSINIEFSNSAGSYLEDVNNRTVNVKTNSGNINIDGVEMCVCNIETSGGLNIHYNKLLGENKINAKTGNIVITLPKDNPMRVECESQTYLDIKVGTLTSVGKDYKYSDDVYGSSSTNKINVNSTTGKIKIRSIDLINY